MNVIYPSQAKQEGPEHTLLQQATKVLEDIVGSFPEEASAEWELVQDGRGRTIYTLTLFALGERVSAPFTLAELRSARPLRSRLLELWGNLLQAGSSAQLRKLRQMVNQED